MELQDELGLNMYDYGARMYMPDIGRFGVVDPMADFVNYQSPYVISDNNPVLNVDEYGLGIFNVIGNLFSRLVGAIGSIGNDCSCNKYTQESVGQAWRRADFPKLNEKINDLFSGSGKSKPTPTSTGGEGRPPAVGINLDPVGITMNDNINIQAPEINIPTPRNLSRENNYGVLPTGTKIDINVRFKASSGVIDAGLSSDDLNSLLKTLVDYPQILLLIQGNVSNSGAPNMDKNTVIKIDNGQGKVGELQLLRAKAIKRFLVKNGIDPTRLSVGQGSIGPNTASATGESR